MKKIFRLNTLYINTLVFLGLLILTIAVSSISPFNSAFAEEKLEEITVYKTPTCGCCGRWISHLEKSGFKVNAINQNELTSIKKQLGIEPNLQACHTSIVGKYFVEGHVPASDIKKLLATKPDIKGISVPNMPMGSPGMEGARKDKYDVLAVKDKDNVTVFNSYEGD